MAPADQPLSHLNFSKTRRIVLLIDLHPLLALRNPAPYLSAVTATAARILHFPPLSSSLFAYKLFFSSLSTLRSASILPRHLSTPSLSFNFAPQTLDPLLNVLNSISTLSDSSNSPVEPRASHTASSLLQLIHDYTWETESENLSGKDDLINGDFVKIPSNLVILLSPIGSMIGCSVDYLESREVGDVFSAVMDAFINRDIHVSWVDVRNDNDEGFESKKSTNEDKYVIVKQGIRRMGWGFCSSDLIVFGSALLPLELIYPKIGVKSDFMRLNDLSKIQYDAQLILEILDVKGVQLECKFGEVEFVKLNSSAGIRSHGISNVSKSTISQDAVHGISNVSKSKISQDAVLCCLDGGSLKLHVKAVYRCGEVETMKYSLGCFLVRECFQKSNKNKKNASGEFFADRVLEMVYGEMAGVTYKSQIPTWQILLSFLHTKGYFALVYVISSKGNTFVGSLKPLTAHLAVLSISDTGLGLVGGPKMQKEDDRVHDTCAENINNSNRCLGSQTDTSTSGNSELHGDGKKKKNRRDQHQEMTWSSFCKAAFGGSNFNLFEVYFAGPNEKSKKLKFLKCWMKQISSVDPHSLTMLPGSKSTEELSASDPLLPVPHQVEEGVMPVSHSETSETFFSNLSHRIQQGLESGMDLQSLAERIVKSSIHWLHHKFETENKAEGQPPPTSSDDCFGEAVARKLVELLLRAPRNMKKIHQDNAASEDATDPCLPSENIVREYELQILLRMEILQSEASLMLEESRKQKLVKHICSLLEIIQFLLPGGLHGHISLYDYVERTIRARYSDVLEDVVKKIYTILDLVPLGDEDEAPCHLFNSEDSNQSWRDRYERYQKADRNGLNKSVSTEGDSSQPLATANDLLEIVGDNHAQNLNEARERRERNRRFVSFTSWGPDLQRVWAPKQRKVSKDEFESVRKKSKRKVRQKSSRSVVCETPMTGNKRACAKGNSVGDEEQYDFGNSSSRSVSKALFQE